MAVGLVSTIGMVAVALELVNIIRFVRGKPLPRIGLLAPVCVAAAGAAVAEILRPSLSLLYVLALTPMIAILRLRRDYGIVDTVLGLSSEVPLLAYTPGFSLDPRGGLALFTALLLSCIAASLATGAVASGDRRMLYVGLALSLVALPIHGYWIAAYTLAPFPPGGPIAAIALLLLVASLAGVYWRLAASYAPLALGLLAGGYAPYLSPVSPVVAVAGLVATLALIVLSVRRLSGGARLGAGAALLLAFLAVVVYAPASGMLPGDAGFTEVLGAGLSLLALPLAEGRGAALRLAIGYFSLALLAVNLIVSGIPMLLECKSVSINLTRGLYDAPRPNQTLVHRFLLLYLFVKEPRAYIDFYERMAAEGKMKLSHDELLRTIRFFEAIASAARAKGIVDTYNITQLDLPWRMPGVVISTDCGVAVTVGPRAAMPSETRALVVGVDANVTARPFMIPVHAFLGRESDKLAIDYLLLVSNPQLTGRDALRYTLYTAMLISYDTVGNASRVAQLLFNYAFNKSAELQPVTIAIVYEARLHVPILTTLSSVIAGVGVAFAERRLRRGK